VWDVAALYPSFRFDETRLAPAAVGSAAAEAEGGEGVKGGEGGEDGGEGGEGGKRRRLAGADEAAEAAEAAEATAEAAEATAEATARFVRRCGETQPGEALEGEARRGGAPACVHCGGPARPAVLLFGNDVAAIYGTPASARVGREKWPLCTCMRPSHMEPLRASVAALAGSCSPVGWP